MDELSQVAKVLAFQPPYQASLAKRAEQLIKSRDAYKAENQRLTAALQEIANNGPEFVPKNNSYWDGQAKGRKEQGDIATKVLNNE